MNKPSIHGLCWRVGFCLCFAHFPPVTLGDPPRGFLNCRILARMVQLALERENLVREIPGIIAEDNYSLAFYELRERRHARAIEIIQAELDGFGFLGHSSVAWFDPGELVWRTVNRAHALPEFETMVSHAALDRSHENNEAVIMRMHQYADGLAAIASVMASKAGGNFPG